MAMLLLCVKIGDNAQLRVGKHCKRYKKNRSTKEMMYKWIAVKREEARQTALHPTAETADGDKDDDFRDGCILCPRLLLL
jgi:hypothetical protein